MTVAFRLRWEGYKYKSLEQERSIKKFLKKSFLWMLDATGIR